MKYRYLHMAVLAALLCVTLFFGVTRYFFTASEAKKNVNAFRQQQGNLVHEAPSLPTVFSFEETSRQPLIPPKLQTLYAQNSDLAGWIQIEGTPIDLPVMYTPQDGEYYLRRFFDKSDNIYGTPFIDARCTLEPRSSNLIIHGHNIKDDEMFGTLPLYAEKDYYEAHPIIKFDTLYETGEYQIVSAFLSQYDENDNSPNLYYRYTDLSNPETMEAFSALMKELSLYDTGFTLAPGDETTMLITCSYHTTNGRMTVVAKKLQNPGKD